MPGPVAPGQSAPGAGRGRGLEDLPALDGAEASAEVRPGVARR